MTISELLEKQRELCCIAFLKTAACHRNDSSYIIKVLMSAPEPSYWRDIDAQAMSGDYILITEEYPDGKTITQHAFYDTLYGCWSYSPRVPINERAKVIKWMPLPEAHRAEGGR